MTEFSTYERIEAYLANQMSPADLADFEKALDADQDLQAEVERHSRAHKVIKYAYYQELKQQLRTIDTESRKPRARITPLLRRIAVAAVLVGAIAIAGTWWINQSYSNTSLAGDFLASFPTEQFRDAGTPSSEMSVEDRYLAAEDLFDQGKYAEAGEAYGALVQDASTDSALAEWNLALCALAMGKQDVFESRLQPILDDASHEFHHRARALKQKTDTRFYRLAN